MRAALAPAVERLERLIGDSHETLLAPPGLALWGRAQRTLQIAEAWATFRDWVERRNPRLAYLVARTLQFGAAVQPAELAAAALVRDEARGRLAHLLPSGAVLCMPTTPCVAPLRGQPLPVLDRVRDRITCLTAHGGLAGHPQLSLPLGEVDGAPVGLSIIGPRGHDEALIALAQSLEDVA